MGACTHCPKLMGAAAPVAPVLTRALLQKRTQFCPSANVLKMNNIMVKLCTSNVPKLAGKERYWHFCD